MSELGAVISDIGRFIPPARMEVEPPGVSWTQGDPPAWLVVVRPRSEEDISRVLRAANRHRRLVTIGGGTSQGRYLVRPGGAIQLDMTGLDRVIDLDVRSQLIRVQAGISIAVLRSRLAERRLQLGWSLYSDAPHTLGGVLSGVPVRWGARYGDVFHSLRAVTIVLPDGGVWREPVAPRRATGPDLSSLALGTRGTMGVVVEAALCVEHWPSAASTVECRVDVSQLPRLQELFRRGVTPHLLEVSVASSGGAQVIASLHGRPSEVGRGVSVLSELSGETPRELISAPFPSISSGESRVSTWTGLAAFCRAWAREPKRAGFVLDQVTLHTVRIVGGGRRGHAAAQDALTGALAADPLGAREHLVRLKQHLDPLCTLGQQ